MPRLSAMAATAEPVSRQAGATTCASIPVSRVTAGNSDPSCVPGSITGASIRVGMPSLSSKSQAQSRVFTLRNCVVVAFVYSQTCSPVSQKLKQIGNRQQLFSGTDNLGRGRPGGIKLVQRVNLHELDARDVVYVFSGGNDPADALHQSVSPGIAIVKGIVEKRAALAEQSVIKPPRVDADPIEATHASRSDGSESALGFQPQPRQIPGRPLL